MTSKPTTPVTQRKYYKEHESTRIPVPISPIPFRRSYSMRMSPRSLVSDKTTKNNNPFIYPHSNNPSSHKIVDSSPKLNGSSSLQHLRKFYFDINGGHSGENQSETMDNDSMDSLTSPKDPNKIDSGGTDGSDKTRNTNQLQSQLKSIDNKHRHMNGGTHNTNNVKQGRGMTLNLNCSGGSNSSRSPRTPQTPKTPQGIHYVKHTHSPKTPPVTPDRYLDDDMDSLNSYSSMASSNCEHPYFARNGTTFSGRKMKYVVHCSSYAGQAGDEYLTPTQRAQRHIRRLKELLIQARQDLELRDSEILKLTKEVVELRLFKASLNSPEECSKSSDCNSVPTVRENTTNDLHTPASEIASPMMDLVDESFKASPKHFGSANRTPNHSAQLGMHQVHFIDKLSTSEMQSSYADSGHFDDITTSSIHSKDSFIPAQDESSNVCERRDDHVDHDRQRLVQMYEEKIEELIKQHDTDISDQKRSNNDKVEALLQKLADCNSRYCDLMPDYEQARERIRELEKELERLQSQLNMQEDKSNKMYLHMFAKENATELNSNIPNVTDIVQPSTSRISVPELMQQLQVTQDELENLRDESYGRLTGNQVLLSAKEAISLWLVGARKTMYKRLIDAQGTKNKVDPEVTLQFLKSAIYYFLTDKENSQGHLNAIESILEFSEKEKQIIEKARRASK